jgi:hypothetical protein
MKNKIVGSVKSYQNQHQWAEISNYCHYWAMHLKLFAT